MGLENVLLLSQVSGYAVALILSLCVTVPMAVHQQDFRGHCLLFSRGQWRESDGQLLVTWASQAYCNYTIFIGVVVCLLSAAQVYRMSMLLWKGADCSFLAAFLDMVASILICAAMAIAGILITLGFHTWCSDITERFESCRDATENPIDKKDGIDTTGFYVQIGTAQFGAWSSWVVWVGLSVCAFLKVCKYHQQENVRVSMARERQRLLNGGSSNATQQLSGDPHLGSPINET